ncbi:unnamed protein product [Oreochromis niloticus]|nr:unnamed protein product [Mustela putorius furo]
MQSLFLTVTHSLRYFYSSSSGVSNFPEFVAVGLVDDVQMIHYDSNTQKAEFKQQWMEKAAEDDPQYSARQTNRLMNTQQVFKGNIDILKQRFNQTGGVHINQMMYVCEWDDEMAEVNGYHQYGYDGEDFISFDLQTETWIAPVMQAVITKLEWDSDRSVSGDLRNYHTQLCPEWLKKYVNYGRSSLMRTGVHVYQEMYGCEWDTETNNVTGYDQLGYDGEDFLAFDLKTETWIAPKQQAVIAKQKCDSDRALSARQKNYFTHICPEWLKKYLNYSGSSLRRTVLPSVSLLQKSSSSPITCHSTEERSCPTMKGPSRFLLIWIFHQSNLRTGGATIVFQLCGVNKDIITRLDRAVIRTNEGNFLFMIIHMILALGVLAVITVIGFIIYKKKTDKRPPSPVENREVQEKMIPCEA